MNDDLSHGQVVDKMSEAIGSMENALDALKNLKDRFALEGTKTVDKHDMRLLKATDKFLDQWRKIAAAVAKEMGAV